MLNLNLLSKNLSISLELQELLPFIVEGATNNYVYIKNQESVYQYANDAFIRLMGFNRLNKMISLSDSDLCEDKGLLKQYQTDDLYVLEEEKKLPIKAIVQPQNNPYFRRELKGTLYPLSVNESRPTHVLGIVSSITKVMQLDWDVIFSLSADKVSDLLIKRQYHISLPWGIAKLSRREIQTLIELLKGSHAGEISRTLGLKQSTIEFYISNTKNKLGVSSKSELLRLVTSTHLLKQVTL